MFVISRKSDVLRGASALGFRAAPVVSPPPAGGGFLPVRQPSPAPGSRASACPGKACGLSSAASDPEFIWNHVSEHVVR